MVIRDYASTIVAVIRLVPVNDLCYMVHTLQLVIKDSLFTQTSVKHFIKKSWKIVGHFEHSEQACRHLSAFWRECEVEEHKLILDVETHWNSSYLMLECLYEQWRAITLFTVERCTIDTLTSHEWDLIHRII